MIQFHTLVASDLDGTLLPEGQTELPCAVFDEIRRLHDCGVLFCAASGRPLDALRELFVKDGAPASAEDGRAILAVSSLSFTRPDDGLLSFSCTNTDGTTARAVVQVRSTKGGAAS